MNDYVYIYTRDGVELTTTSAEVAIARRSPNTVIYAIDETGKKSILEV